MSLQESKCSADLFGRSVLHLVRCSLRTGGVVGCCQNRFLRRREVCVGGQE
jgi:hypothetical protein